MSIAKTIASLENVQADRSPTLLVIAGPNIGRPVPIEKNEFIIGRVDSCDMPINDDLVSRHHCKITILPNGEAQLADLGSTNGTLLNGRKVSKAKIHEGDKIQVGALTILEFYLQADVATKFQGELFEAATKDFLTNVYNRKYLMDRLQTEFFYTKRHGGDLSILVIDIDFFKKINDTYGHLVGDIALQKLGHFLLTHTRKDDVVARFGGEEFIVLMRDCDLAQAKILAETLRKGISKIPVKTPKKTINMTVSVGAAALSEATKKELIRYENLIEKADSQLYRAKESGRNKVCA